MHSLSFAAAVLSLLGVGLGAFGAHRLSGRLDEPHLKTYQTGVQYHLIHGVAAWAAGFAVLLLPRPGLLVWAGWLFVGGVVLFSGSLYLLSFGRLRGRWGLVTPLGGFLFIVGWALAAVRML